MGFHDLNGILLQSLITIIWSLEILWDCQLGRNMEVGLTLQQPSEMLVGQTTRLTDYFVKVH